MKISLILVFSFILSTFLEARVVSSSHSYTTSSSRVKIISPPPSRHSNSGHSGGSSNYYTSNTSSSSTSGSSGYTPPPKPEVLITIVDNYIFSEEDAKQGKVMNFNIAFSKPLTSDITLKYNIQIDKTSTAAITLGSDIREADTNTITIPSGTTSANIPIHVIDDSKVEDAEYFFINLNTPSSTTQRFSFINNQSLGVILDNDKKISSSKGKGNYKIYEHNTNNTNIDTKIVYDDIKLDIYAENDGDILHNITTSRSTSCVDVGCSQYTASSGATVEQCTQDCTTTVTTTYDYESTMDIKKVLLHRFKDYNNISKKCEGELQPLTIDENISISSTQSVTIDVPSDSAYRCAYIEVIGLSATDYYTMLPELYSGVSDLFAIRPKEFLIEADKVVTAAKSFTLKVKAVGSSNKTSTSSSTSQQNNNTNTKSDSNSFFSKLYSLFQSKKNSSNSNNINKKQVTRTSDDVLNYNQKNNTTFTIKASDQIYHEANITDLGFDFSGFEFKNGSWSNVIKYKEVGKVDINISENPSNYFAMVDNSNSFIKPYSKTIEFIADSFSVDYQSLYKNYDLAFISNDILDANAYIKLNIKALNADKDVVTRYTKDGYAKDTNLTMKQSIYTTDNISSGKRELKSITFSKTEANTIFDVNGSDVDTVVSFTKDDFLNGILSSDKIDQTFKRVDNQAINPIKLSTKKVSIFESLSPTIRGEKSNNNIFSDNYYVRAYVPNMTVAGNDVNATVYYETYCKSCDKSKFAYSNKKASIDSVYWYILPSNSYDNSTCDIKTTLNTSNNSIVDTLKKVDFKTIYLKVKKSPATNRVFYTPSYSYLFYDRYKTPVVKHKFDIDFTSSSAKWAGEGNLGNTVDTDISNTKNNSLED